jgi:hypothetical protein
VKPGARATDDKGCCHIKVILPYVFRFIVLHHEKPHGTRNHAEDSFRCGYVDKNGKAANTTLVRQGKEIPFVLYNLWC